MSTTGMGITANPVHDAVNNGLYLQFGMECTGEVAYLMFVEKSPDTKCNSKSCSGPIPKQSNCYRPQDGIIEVDTGVGFRCNNSLSKLPDSSTSSFTGMKSSDTRAEYWNTFKFNGSEDAYVPVYGFPYVAYPSNPSKYNLSECNVLGTATKTSGIIGQQTCNTSMISSKSCEFLNKESWLLGGGLTNESMEEFLHSELTRAWLISIISGIPGAPENPESIIFKIPFCVEDLSGYSGWLHNFKNGYNNKSLKFPDLVNFPDQEIKYAKMNGEICKSTAAGDKGGNIPCLGQTILSQDGTFTPEWVAGTLNYDEIGKTWSCPTGIYYS
jgi:hypothetical protein